MKRTAFIIFLILVFIGVRSLHFSEVVNFSADQARDSAQVLQIWREKKIVLIGPPVSYEYEGRQIFVGSTTYYFQLMFLLIGGFDPIKSSFAFMVFCSLTLIPLYFGVKNLVSEKAAALAMIIFTLLPLYKDYTSFFWNPNFQFALSPILIFVMGEYARIPKKVFLFLIGVTAGILFTFHYQFLFIVIGLFIYYAKFVKLSAKRVALMTLGIIVGVGPLLIFELRNQFYTLKTLRIFFQHASQVFGRGDGFPPHYFLTISLFMLILALYYLQKHFTQKIIFGSFVILCVICLIKYLPTPTHAFGMIENWNTKDELKVHEIISQQHLSNYNIVNPNYDTVAQVQKYLLEKDQQPIDQKNYTSNQYLFVITNQNNFMNNPAYELNTFQPSSITQKWGINSTYTLYLVERLQTTP